METDNYYLPNKCKFCLDNDLEKVGAHMVTDALCRSAVYTEGQIKRGDYEAIAEISRTKIGFVYFGNSVLPEKRTELLGRNQTEEEIDNPGSNNFINRKIVCRRCEKLFGPIEKEFIDKVYDYIIDPGKRTLVGGNFELDSKNSWICRLNTLINIWRCSAGDFQGWKLSIEKEKSIRDYLWLVLSSGDSIDKYISLAQENNPNIGNQN